MACNCGTKEEIDRLYRAFGEKKDNLEDMTLWEKIKHGVYTLFTVLLWVIIFPLMTIYLLLFIFWHEPGDRRINVQNFNLLKIFHLGKYARE